jgi:hypothetical protein
VIYAVGMKGRAPMQQRATQDFGGRGSTRYLAPRG